MSFPQMAPHFQSQEHHRLKIMKECNRSAQDASACLYKNRCYNQKDAFNYYCYYFICSNSRIWYEYGFENEGKSGPQNLKYLHTIYHMLEDIRGSIRTTGDCQYCLNKNKSDLCKHLEQWCKTTPTNTQSSISGRLQISFYYSQSLISVETTPTFLKSKQNDYLLLKICNFPRHQKIVEFQFQFFLQNSNNCFIQQRA